MCNTACPFLRTISEKGKYELPTHVLTASTRGCKNTSTWFALTFADYYVMCLRGNVTGEGGGHAAVEIAAHLRWRGGQIPGGGIGM